MARFSRWVATIAEICMFLTSAAFLVTVDPRALVVWLAVGTLYIIGGFAAAWRGVALPQDGLDEAPSTVSWTWIPPLFAAAAGAASAVTALVAHHSPSRCCSAPSLGGASPRRRDTPVVHRYRGIRAVANAAMMRI